MEVCLSFYHLGGNTQGSNEQHPVDIFASRAASDKFQLNETKCKEMRICFSTNGTPNFNPIVIRDKQIAVVSHAKILGDRKSVV